PVPVERVAVVPSRRAGGAQPVGRPDARMGDGVPAHTGELRRATPADPVGASRLGCQPPRRQGDGPPMAHARQPTPQPARRFTAEVGTYGAMAASLALGGIIYGVWSREAIGTILLVLTGVFAGIVAGYLALQDRLEKTTARAATTEEEPPESDQFLPHASIWPFEMGAGTALALSGVVLGWALLLPGILL